MKTTVLYTALFGLILAAAAGGSAWVLTERGIRMERMNRVTSFVSERFPGMEREHFDLESFAQANRIHIDVLGPHREILESYGPVPVQTDRNNEIVRQVPSRKGPVLIRVVDLESPGFLGRLTTGGFYAILAGMIALAAVSGALLMRRMMRPVREMDRTIQQISANDLSRRIDTVHSHDELKELAEAFNKMLDRLQQSYEQQIRFVSDASHELRTPLSVISGYANLLRRWGGEDKAIRQESVGKIIEETENMRQLIERMLFLARTDHNTQAVNLERFDFSALMREILEETRLIDTEHVLSSHLEPGITGTADRALVKQAVRAVLENSMKFTPKGGEISLSCRQRDGKIELAVRDNGIGIPAESLPHIFDRFYKADASRTRGEKGSSGLGLSIVKWIVKRHGGQICARSSPGAGTTVTMVFPKNLET